MGRIRWQKTVIGTVGKGQFLETFGEFFGNEVNTSTLN